MGTKRDGNEKWASDKEMGTKRVSGRKREMSWMKLSTRVNETNETEIGGMTIGRTKEK